MIAGLLMAMALAGVGTEGSAELSAGGFASPPDAARPWVYWFWKNGNVSRAGITADLEAMQRVGIGGVIFMEVALSVPAGPTEFFSPAWREEFRFAVSEAKRLGLQVSLNSAPGWTGSGGPWVAPEQSMQKVVFSQTDLAGPRAFAEKLPQPEAVRDFYRDIAVLAFPTPSGEARIADIAEKALYQRGPISSMPGVRPAFPAVADYEEVPADQVVPLDRIVDLTARMDASGRLAWDVPEGMWTVLRIGHTSTGQTNRPAPLPGLECDKLDPAAVEAHFRQYTAELLDELGPDLRGTLVATHLDSWEVGAQNWTGRFREEFQRRRGYDLLPYLPVMQGWVVGGVERSERFLWDLRQTASELLVENHGRRLRDLAHEHGQWFSIEPYDMTPCDDMTLGATADVPMCEFWSKGFDTRYSVKEATSIAHVYGKPIVAAEAFTSVDRWLFHPASVKALGDWAYCEGVNRLVIHRSIHQPFMQVRPGLSLGPHGLHYERTQTWWEYSGPWHQYLARCQFVLQQGRNVADVLYLSPEGAPNVVQMPDPPPRGYRWDACTPEALLSRVTVTDSQLALPDGSRYRLLVLPDAEAMTPAMAARIREIVEAGATVIGRPARKSPSLAGYPDCDAAVRRDAQALWGALEAPATPELRRVGRGHVVWADMPPRIRPDSTLDAQLARARWIWFPEGQPAATAPTEKRYFQRVVELDADARIASALVAMTADNAFQLFVNGRSVLEGENFHLLYQADIAPLLRPGPNTLAVVAENSSDAPNPAGLIGALVIQQHGGNETVVLTDSSWHATREAAPGWPTGKAAADAPAALELGALGMGPWGKLSRATQLRPIYAPSRQVEAVLAAMRVPPDLDSDRPLRWAHKVVGSAHVYFVSNGEAEAVETRATFRVPGGVPELWCPMTGKTRRLPEYRHTEDKRTEIPLRFEPAGSYFLVFRSPVEQEPAPEADPKGRNFPPIAPLAAIAGPWHVAFDPALGGPADPVTFPTLDDWATRPEDGIRYYSGEATYTTTFPLPKSEGAGRLLLDLGRVEVMARVKLNGKDLGILWKTPYRVAIDEALQPGENRLEITVVNLWPNRMIGDEHLPPDSDRTAGGTLKAWPTWLGAGQKSPTGRHTFSTWRHWMADSPLVPSGLLGPVELYSEEKPIQK